LAILEAEKKFEGASTTRSGTDLKHLLPIYIWPNLISNCGSSNAKYTRENQLIEPWAAHCCGFCHPKIWNLVFQHYCPTMEDKGLSLQFVLYLELPLRLWPCILWM